KRVFKPETIALMWTRSLEGNGSRALGWDISSSFSVTTSPFFPADSVGHLGFTGTSVWMNPASRSYLIVLTNRVHPSGGAASELRSPAARAAAAASAAFFRPAPRGTAAVAAAPAPAADGGEDVKPASPASVVRSGLDVLVAQNFAPIAGSTIGLVTNQTG